MNWGTTMRAKSERRLRAERLRREGGLSYSEIEAQTGISRSTLSSWLREIPLSAEQEARLQGRLRANRAAFAARALPINRKRYRDARRKASQAGEAVLNKIAVDHPIRELAFAMLYLGDGAKTHNRVSLSSIKPGIIRYFIHELLNLYQVDKSKIKVNLHLIQSARTLESKIMEWWSMALNWPAEHFAKTQYDRRKTVSKVTNSYHGVCIATVYDTYLQERILGLAQAFIQHKPEDG
jgi:transcriptional regulator with XRE-family HTH domain